MPLTEARRAAFVVAPSGPNQVWQLDFSADFGGPPLHHHAFDETFYVLKGELTFQLGEELVTRRAGELAVAPRDVPHTFANLSGAEARTLIICTPAGLEHYVDRIAAREAGVELPAEGPEL